MKPPPRHVVALLAVVGLLAVLSLLAADWNWARPAVLRYLEHKSGREVKAADLQVRLDAHWQPVVRVRGLRVANAPWASGDRPFIVAREASFTFDWATLLSDVRVMRELRLVDADIDLQRQADGLRNWRLTRPDDRGRARMRIQRLQVERSRLTLNHRGLGLTLEAAATPLAQADGAYTQRIHFRGRFGEARWAGEADTGPVLSMVDTGERFPVRGIVRSDGTQLAVQGQAADLLQLSAVDARVQLHGDTLARLQPFLPRAAWPGSAPYRFDGRVVREGATWSARDAQLQLGRSDLQGEARYTPAGPQHEARATLHATLKSERLSLQDLPSREGHAATADRPAPGQRVLPQRELAFGPLRTLDGRLSLHVARLELPQGPPARQLQATVALEGGEVDVRLQQGTLGGGRWQGRFVVDTQARTPEVTLDLQARGVKPTELWPPLARQAAMRGVQWPSVDAELKLRSLGPTLASWWRGMSGRIDLSVAGGSLPRKLDARLGLHAGRMLGALVAGDEAVPIRCGAVSLAFSSGVGSVHLAEESWALVLTPQTRGGTLPASIVAQGTFRGAKVQLAQREPVPATGHCAASPGRSG